LFLDKQLILLESIRLRGVYRAAESVSFAIPIAPSGVPHEGVASSRQGLPSLAALVLTADRPTRTLPARYLMIVLGAIKFLFDRPW